MRTKLFAAVTGLFLFALSFYMPREASAVPAFSRQTGLACNSCHFQHFPTLNSFGRAFKAGGYTQVGGQSMVEGDLLSIPAALNATLVTKIRYQKTNGPADESGTNKGELLFPDEGALLIGGRAGEHVGFLLEAQLINPEDAAFASFKLPFTYDLPQATLSFIPFTTDAAGAPYGFELLNTGALRMQRPLEHRSDISAQQYIGTATEATGFSFVAYTPMVHANYTLYSPEHLSTDAGPYLHYARAAVTPTFEGWDLAAGVQWWGGTAKYSVLPSGTERKDGKAWAIDAQAQGTAGAMPLGVYLSYGTAEKSDATENLFNTETADDRTAWSVLAELGVIPNRATVAAAYRAGKNGTGVDDSDNATTLGATYLAAQNVEFQLNHSWYGGKANSESNADGDQLTTLMIFAAF